jgi:hypothetical protein
MKGKSLLSLIVGLTVTTSSSASVLAQPRQTLQSLSNGEYFYGESSKPNRLGERYIVFRKTGRTIIGYDYYEKSDAWECFRGTVSRNSITNITAASSQESDEINQLQFYPTRPKELSQFSPIRSNRLPSKARENLQYCNQVFKNRW